MAELKVLISREDIAKRVAELGAQDHARTLREQSIIFVGVLKGAAIFLSDLARQVDLDCYVRLHRSLELRQSPQPDSGIEERVGFDRRSKTHKRRRPVYAGKERDRRRGHSRHRPDSHVLKKLLLAHQPKALKIAALLDKPSRRKLPLEGDYVGFKIPDEFVVGYGLDYAEKYRNLAGYLYRSQRVSRC